MHETERQAYLRAMGIKAWFPRFIMPVAKPSSLYEDFQEKSAKNEPVHQTSETFTKHIDTSLVALIDSESDIKKETNVTQQENYIQTETVTPQDLYCAAPFRLGVVSPAEDLLVVTDIPLTKSSGSVLSESLIGLLSSILHALRWECSSSAEWEKKAFTWPLIGLDQNLSEQEASEAVQGFLNNQFGFLRRKRLLFFGRFSVMHGLVNYDNVDQLYGVHRQPNGAVCGCTYGLDQLLKLPDLKAESWVHLSPINTNNGIAYATEKNE